MPQNYAEAMKWFSLAANQGHADAQFNLGRMFDIGRGVPQKHVQVHTWFNLAGAGGSWSGRKNRDMDA